MTRSLISTSRMLCRLPAECARRHRLGKIPELLRRAFCEEGYHGFLTLEPHLAMFDFFAPGAKGGESQKLQFENNPIVEKMKSEMAEPGRPKDGAEAYATQYHALVEILNPILN